MAGTDTTLPSGSSTEVTSSADTKGKGKAVDTNPPREEAAVTEDDDDDDDDDDEDEDEDEEEVRLRPVCLGTTLVRLYGLTNTVSHTGW